MALNNFYSNQWFSTNLMFSSLNNYWYKQLDGANKDIAKHLLQLSGQLNVLNQLNNVKANFLNDPDRILAFNHNVTIDNPDVITNNTLTIDVPMDILTIRGCNDTVYYSGIDFVYRNGKLQFKDSVNIKEQFGDVLSDYKLVFILNGYWEAGVNSQALSVYRGLLSVDYLNAGQGAVDVAEFIKGSKQTITQFEKALNAMLGCTSVKAGDVAKNIVNVVKICEDDNYYKQIVTFDDNTVQTVYTVSTIDTNLSINANKSEVLDKIVTITDIYDHSDWSSGLVDNYGIKGSQFDLGIKGYRDDIVISNDTSGDICNDTAFIFENDTNYVYGTALYNSLNKLSPTTDWNDTFESMIDLFKFVLKDNYKVITINIDKFLYIYNKHHDYDTDDLKETLISTVKQYTNQYLPLGLFPIYRITYGSYSYDLDDYYDVGIIPETGLEYLVTKSYDSTGTTLLDETCKIKVLYDSTINAYTFEFTPSTNLVTYDDLNLQVYDTDGNIIEGVSCYIKAVKISDDVLSVSPIVNTDDVETITESIPMFVYDAKNTDALALETSHEFIVVKISDDYYTFEIKH